jgi:plastocyanin
MGSWWLVLEVVAQAATIEGTVRFTGAVVEQEKLIVTSDQYVCGQYKESQDLIMSADQGIHNAVVSLQTPPSGVTWYSSGPPPQIDQNECVFIPRLVIVPVGGTMEFLNSDRLLHNIRSKDIVHNRAFNRTQPRGRTIPITFTKPEIVRVGCDLHPWMRSWVVVVDHPFYTITNDDGEFTLDNVPSGQHTLEIWHETLGTVTTEITVWDEGITKVTIEMSSP